MGLFDSTKSSSTSNTTSQTADIANVDNRVADGDGAIFGGNVNLTAAQGGSLAGVSVMTSDYGAVAAGIGAAVHASDLVAENAALGAKATQSAIEKTLQLAANNSAAQGAETTQKFLKYGAIVALVGLAAWAFVRRAG